MPPRGASGRAHERVTRWAGNRWAAEKETTMSVTQDRTGTSGSETFESVSPATGDVVATLPVHGEAEVRQAVQVARKAAQWWQELGFDGRRERLEAYAGVLTRRREELLDLI